jgi:bifunctional non-homologous end joining protein LigD
MSKTTRSRVPRGQRASNLAKSSSVHGGYSEHLTGDGQEMFEHAAKLNWEGIISKRADAPYRSERNENWLKIKVVQKGRFPVVGFVKDPTGVAALYLGKREGNDLVYMGKVGTGWSRTISSQIRKQLDTVISPKSKLTKAIKKPRATWVEPNFFCRYRISGYHFGRLAAGQFIQGTD